MSSRRTQEEKLLLAIFHAPAGSTITTIGRQLGLTDKSCRHAMQLLLHGNFIRKIDNDTVRMTEHGVSLCQQLEHQL